MIISKTYQAGLCCDDRFLRAKKINLHLGILGFYFLNTGAPAEGEGNYICKINKDFHKNHH